VIDTNIYLHRWPFRRLPGDDPPGLVARLSRAGVTQAWAGSFNALLADDLSEVNGRLAVDCRRHGAGLLLPFGSVNPALPDWREELRRCADEHRMRGIRAHPNYHGYTLAAPAFQELLRAAAGRGLLVQIAVQMQDERTQHPLVRAAPVNVAALPKVEGARIQLLNAGRAAAAAGPPTDFAMVEGVHGLRNLARTLPAGHLVFGSYYPCFYFEAAVLKLKESGLDRGPIETENARRLLAGTGDRP
jgi:predicted TIM-barrel fold metal-dependent hydrolase